MISRKAARLLAETYTLMFSKVTTGQTIRGPYKNFRLLNDDLRDFLYDEEYPDWILYILNCSTNVANSRILKDRIMVFHTGEVFALFKNPYTDVSLEEKQAAGQTFLRKLAQSILSISETKTLRDKVTKPLNTLKAQLELDGYVYKNGKLYESEASVIDEQEERIYLEKLANESKLADPDVIKHHLKLSEQHFLERNWDDSISNSRKVLDAILKQITQALYLKVENTPAPPGLLKNAKQTREYLERQSIVTTIERESLDKNYGLLSVTGGHPYIAEKDQARLMRHLALTFSQFVLLRYQGYLAENPNRRERHPHPTSRPI
jgi:hypothetical protein